MLAAPPPSQVKIQGQNKEMLAAACQMFLGKSESEIGQIALETLEGHQRAIMAHMTVEVGLWGGSHAHFGIATPTPDQTNSEMEWDVAPLRNPSSAWKPRPPPFYT